MKNFSKAVLVLAVAAGSAQAASALSTLKNTVGQIPFGKLVNNQFTKMAWNNKKISLPIAYVLLNRAVNFADVYFTNKGESADAVKWFGNFKYAWAQPGTFTTVKDAVTTLDLKTKTDALKSFTYEPFYNLGKQGCTGIVNLWKKLKPADKSKPVELEPKA